MRGRRDFSELFLLAGILLVAINLRAALSSIGPLVDFIRDDLGLSRAAFGLVTTLPVLAFGFVSVLTPVFTRTFGIGRTVLGAMALLTIGIGLRSVFGVFGLYLGTLFLGIAIALGNVSIPILTKQHFSDRAGMITGIYSCLMSLGAAVAAGVSVPLAVNFGFGWRGSLAVWALPSLFAFIFWLPRGGNFEKQKRSRSFFEGLRRLSRIGLVWQIAGFMGLQSMAFYVVLAWLPAI